MTFRVNPDKLYNKFCLLFLKAGECVSKSEGRVLGIQSLIKKSQKTLYTHAAFKKIKKTITIVAQKRVLILHLSIKPDTVAFEEGFSRDVSDIGHWGTGKVEICIKNKADSEKAKPLLDRAYNEN